MGDSAVKNKKRYIKLKCLYRTQNSQKAFNLLGSQEIPVHPYIGTTSSTSKNLNKKITKAVKPFISLR